LPSWDERSHEAADGLDLPDEVAGEVDDMSSKVAECSRTGRRLVEAPYLLGGVAPVLQVPTAEVTKLTELTCLDQLSRQAHRRDEAIVECAHVLHAGCRDATPDVVALVCVAS